MTKREALERYGATVRERNRAYYVGIVRRFLLGGGSLTRPGLTLYARTLEAKGTRPSTINLYLTTLQKFARVSGVGWPGVDWFWDKRRDPVRRIAATADFLWPLVAAAREGRLEPRMRAWLALSTLYGCRAAELWKWTQADLGAGDTVYIHRVKDGDSRWYWLPPAVRPYLEGVLRRPAHREQELYEAWHAAVQRVHGETGPDWAVWHTIRRGLVHELRGHGVSDENIHAFIGWSGPTTGDMVDIYANPTAKLDAGAAERVVAPEPAGSDRIVWKAHPYLPLWTHKPRTVDAPADGGPLHEVLSG